MSSVLSAAAPILEKAGAIASVLNGIRAGIRYLERRGLQRERIVQLLEIAERDDRDLTQSEVAEVLAEAQNAIDALKR